MHADTKKYNQAQSPADRATCQLLAEQIDRGLPEAENRIWHGHPVWFLEGNPIVGYGKLKTCVRLLFWSGQSFDEEGLDKEGTFKAAEKPRQPKNGIQPPIKSTRKICGVGWPRRATSSGTTKTSWGAKAVWTA